MLKWMKDVENLFLYKSNYGRKVCYEIMTLGNLWWSCFIPPASNLKLPWFEYVWVWKDKEQSVFYKKSNIFLVFLLLRNRALLKSMSDYVLSLLRIWKYLEVEVKWEESGSGMLDAADQTDRNIRLVCFVVVRIWPQSEDLHCRILHGGRHNTHGAGEGKENKLRSHQI